MKHKLCTISIFCLCLFGCGNSNIAMYHDAAFEEVADAASKKQSLFCIVLVDSAQTFSKEYVTHLLQNPKLLTSRAIYNIVDVNSSGSEWYSKWLLPVYLPLTCVFLADGTLLDIIPGAAKETFLYTDLAIKSKSVTDYHCPNSFNVHKEKLISIFNDVLKQKLNLNQHTVLPVKLKPVFDSLNYPYPFYLKMNSELLQKDTIQAQKTAKLLLDTETPYLFELYRDEFLAAKTVLNPDFNIAGEPHIRVNKEVINIENCLINKDTAIKITVHNDGCKHLKISKIQTSCSCVKQITPVSEFIVNSKDSVSIDFVFLPDREGEMTREILILSNAVNKSVLDISIFANVINE